MEIHFLPHLPSPQQNLCGVSKENILMSVKKPYFLNKNLIDFVGFSLWLTEIA